MRRVRAVGIAAAVAMLIAVFASSAGAALPPPGSTLAADDLHAPTIPAGTTVASISTWLTAGIAARSTAVSAAVATEAGSKGLTAAHRATLTTIFSGTTSSLGAIGLANGVVKNLTAARAEVSAMIDLHVFSVVLPVASDVESADTERSQVGPLLAAEPSIRAAIVAAKSARFSVVGASAQLIDFSADLVAAQNLVDPLASRALSDRFLSIDRANAALANVARSETAVAGLISSAETAEQTIVTLLASAPVKTHLSAA